MAIGYSSRAEALCWLSDEPIVYVAVMPASHRLLTVLTVALTLSACATRTDVVSIDLVDRAGVYVLGYSEHAELRRAMETQLVEDLRRRDLSAYASHLDLPDITAMSREQLLAAANARQAAAIIVINRVAADASDSIVKNPERVSPVHPDLQAFYRYSESREPLPRDPAQRVFAEVNLFLLEEDRARLFWSGTTWSFHSDTAAVRGISEVIAEQLARLSAQLRG